MRPLPLSAISVAAAIAILVLGSAPVGAAWLQPIQGSGHFDFTCDAVTLPDAGGGHDVVVMVSIPHRNLVFEEDAGMFRSRVECMVTLRGHDGTMKQARSTHRLSSRNRSEAESLSLSQTFVVTLQAVGQELGALEIRVEDLQRRRPGLKYLATDEKAFAVARADWYALPQRESRGLAVGDAVFLAHAPIRDWAVNGRPTPAGQGGPWDFINPQRRYGLETPAMQLYFTVSPPRRIEDRQRAAERPLLVRIESDELDFALVDTIVTTAAVQSALAAGRDAAVYWEMDAGGLPPGRFRLGIAPLDEAGRALLTTFDVVWSLEQLVRTQDDLLGEGRTVLMDDDLDAFLAASRVEQSVMLDRFWEERDPTPDDPYNEARAEFYRRVRYVKTFLGGFGAGGARDDRGSVYLLLGEPDVVHEEAMPLNENTVMAARMMVFDRFRAAVEAGTGTSPWDYNDYAVSVTDETANANLRGFVPYIYHDVVIASHTNHLQNTRGFLYWGYDEQGEQLFLNTYTGRASNLRFFFVDPTGDGTYKLESTNTRDTAG